MSLCQVLPVVGITLLLLLFSCATCNVLDLIQLDTKLDADVTLCQLGQSTLDPVLADTVGKYVLIDDQLITGAGGLADEYFVRQTAQLLSPVGYKVCTVTNGINKDPNAVDLVVVRVGGHQVPYYGKLDPQTLVRYVQQLEQKLTHQPYRTITNKMDKKAFEHVVVPKVVAYFPDLTAPSFVQFQKAAAQLAPNPPFYAVHDPLIAAKFRLTQPGQLALIRRLEKSTTFFPSVPVTPAGGTPSAPIVLSAEEIVAWISTNRGLILHELDDTNLYDPEVVDVNKYQLVAVADKTSPLGLYFFKILTKTIQNISRENEMKRNPSLFVDEQEEGESQPNPTSSNVPATDVQLIDLDDIEVIWVDLQKYPSVGAKLRLQNIAPVQDVWFGLIQTPTTGANDPNNQLQPVWFDLATLNTTSSDKKADESNILLVRQWILTVTNRLLSSDGTAPVSGQTFALEPEPVSVRAGGNFVLDCQVVNKVGTCGWTLNGVPVVVGVPPYQWTSNNHPSDCSLSVTGANVKRDSGSWICNVSGANGSVQGSIKSKPITVTVRTGQMSNKGEL